MLATAFGLANAGQVFANLPHATAEEQLDARHMNTALWQATWGYFLLQMLGVGAAGESPLTDDDIAWAREHFIDYVRAERPAAGAAHRQAALRRSAGDLARRLEATSRPGRRQTRDVALRDLLIRLRDLWRRNFAEVPRLGRSPDSTTERGFDKDLAEVLSMDGLSSDYSIRDLIGRHYLEHLVGVLERRFLSGCLGTPPSRSRRRSRSRPRKRSRPTT